MLLFNVACIKNVWIVDGNKLHSANDKYRVFECSMHTIPYSMQSTSIGSLGLEIR